ncbi:MAG: hypothetical protein GF341_07020 [candidate division Zixibacteria bacterium]|nr:hypothetical protein [candidate division Zixibacteria bacterium]
MTIAVLAFLPSLASAQRGMAIDYFATAEDPSETMAMLFTRVTTRAEYDGPAITLRSSLYVPGAVAMSKVQVTGGGLLGATREEYDHYILYNPRIMALADRAGFKTIAQMAILAREIGHHLHCETNTRYPSNAIRHSARTFDPAADEYVGFVLARVNASISEAVEAQRFLLVLAGRPEAESIEQRIDAVVDGWERGQGPDPETLRARLTHRLENDSQSIQSWW